MKSRFPTIAIAVAAGLVAATSAHACNQPKDESAWTDRAEAAIHKIQSWDDLHTYYVGFVRDECFDGAIEEEYSDLVADRFVRHWETLEEYVALGTADPGFKKFVLEYLSSELYGLDEARATYRLARDHCPARDHAACAEIIDNALKVDPKGVKAEG